MSKYTRYLELYTGAITYHETGKFRAVRAKHEHEFVFVCSFNGQATEHISCHIFGRTFVVVII